MEPTFPLSPARRSRAPGSLTIYRSLFERATLGMVMVDARGAPIRANAAALQLLALTLPQLCGPESPPADWRVENKDGKLLTEPFRAVVGAAASQDIAPLWHVLSAGGDGERWLYVTASPVHHAQRRAHAHTLISLTDVTEGMRRRQALVSVAEQSTGELTALRAALDRMTDAFVVLDYSGRFTYVNARAHEQFAPGGEQMLGRPFWEVFPILVGTPMELEFQRVMHDPSPGTIETEVAEGLWLEVRSYPAQDGISVYIRDISEHKRTVAELDAALAREREAHGEAEDRAQQLDTIFEAVSDALVVFGADGSALRANRAMRGLMALLGERLSLPMSAADFDAQMRRFSTDDAGQSSMAGRPLRRILRGESLTGEQTLDLVVRTPAERQLHLNISGAPIRGSDGAIVGAVESLRDVTANREAEQERSQTLSMVAHELRTPLTAIKLSLDLSLRRVQRHIPIEPSAFTVALTSCLQLERMVTDLVDAARAERQNLGLAPELCDAREIAAQAVAEQQTTTQRAILIATPLTPAPIVADATRIRQVLSNLLSNALKYSPPESSVALQVELREESVWFGVRDDGPGVGVEAVPHLFEAFYRAPNAGSLSGPNVGLGLGLYLCKRIVDQHGGQIGMQNRPQGGSLFWFSIPFAQPESDGA